MFNTSVRRFLMLVVVVMCGLSTGCASIIGGAHKTITVSSNPSNVPVTVYDFRSGAQVAKGTTPFQVTLKRGAGYFTPAKYEFKATMPGKRTKVVGYKAGIHGWYWGNILLGGLIGMVIVDPITGAMWDPPEIVSIDLSEFAMSTRAEMLAAEISKSEAIQVRAAASARGGPPGS